MTTKKSKKSTTKRRTASKRKAREARATKARPPRATKARDPRLPAVGKSITREFKGKTYELKVTADGFALGDVHFRTLTAAAKAVTKYPSVSGVRFWLGAGEKGGAK